MDILESLGSQEIERSFDPAGSSFRGNVGSLPNAKAPEVINSIVESKNSILSIVTGSQLKLLSWKVSRKLEHLSTLRIARDGRKVGLFGGSEIRPSPPSVVFHTP